MNTQYRCKNERRRDQVRKQLAADQRPLLNGIDYLELSSDQKTLVVYFIHDLVGSTQLDRVPTQLVPLTEENITIRGGTRIQTVQVESASSFANVLLLRVDQIGDFSTYTLRLVRSPIDFKPPLGIDPQLAQVEFSFWVEELSEFDCSTDEPPPEKPPAPPVIDYLSKDYASFRRLMLDRLTVTMPQWRERNPSDVGVMLVELMAYAADYLSYYQDAVATEAYLGTARKRVSMRRHARLLDYFLHDGCNSRTWIVFQIDRSADGITLLGPSVADKRPGTRFLTAITTETFPIVIPNLEKFKAALNAGAQVFESMEDLTLQAACNQLQFYTWGDETCWLPKGATQASLHDPDRQLRKRLHPGKVLIFAEVLGATTGQPIDANPLHRHAVRLTKVTPDIDPLTQSRIIQIEWARADALPFDFCISTITASGKPIDNISVVWGNVVLVDFGCTVPLPVSDQSDTMNGEDLSQAADWQRFRPRLAAGPLTQQGYVLDCQNRWVLFDRNAPASAMLHWEMRNTQPAITLWETSKPEIYWQNQPDLLNSDRFARDFVVETEDDQRAYLRFGDNILGKRPKLDELLSTTYRIGNGRSGNVGAQAIQHIYLTPNHLPATDRLKLDALKQSILKISNPLAAEGGTDPEPIEQVRRDAPQAFRTQRRAVTPADYATITQQYPGVQRAVATRRWTGSWYTMFITVDRENGQLIDQSFKDKLLTFLDQFRLSGHDIEIDEPRFVPLSITMTVQVAADYFQSTVKKALLEAFSNSVLLNGQLGFFHPDNFTFGQAVYLSRVIAAAMQVAGVQSVRVIRFQRWGQPPDRELETGQITLEPLEIARLENNPNSPENGRLVFTLEGGL